MTICVTGGGGYIGSHMILALLEAGEKVITVDNLSTGFYWAIDERAEMIIGDIGNRALMESILKRHHVTSVIHFAAKTVVPESVRDPLGYYYANTAKTRELLEACVHSGVKNFVFSSTAAVYGVTGDAPVSEDDGKNPISPYGSSKLMSEQMIKDTCGAHPLKYAILRYFNVAGADPLLRTGQSTANATHLIKVAVQAALGERSHLDVYGTSFNTKDGTGVRDYIHVSDLAKAHLDALSYLKSGGDNITCNVGYGEGYSVNEVISAVKTLTNVDFKVNYCEARAGDAASVIANSTLAKEVLQWRPRYNALDVMVKHAYKWEAHLAVLHQEATLAPDIMPMFAPLKRKLAA